MKIAKVLFPVVVLVFAVSVMAAEEAGKAKAAGSPEVKKAEEKSAQPVKVDEKKAEATPAVVKAEEKKPESAKPAVDPEKVVVTVNGVKVLEKEVWAKVEQGVNSWKSMAGDYAKTMPEERLEGLRKGIRKQVLEMLVDQELMKQKMKAAKIEVSDQQVDEEIKKICEQNKITVAEMEAQMTKSGMTMAEFRDRIKMFLGIDKLISAEAGEKALSVSDEDIKKFFDENQEYFSEPEQVRASHILIKTEGLDEAGKAKAKEKAADLLKQVKGGKDFAELAKVNSDCSSKDKGGDLGFFGRGDMVKEFSDTAFSMQPGSISDIVETEFGYHIIKVVEKKAAKTTTFEEAKDNIRKQLESQRKQEFFNDYRTKIKAEAKIEWAVDEAAGAVVKPAEKTTEVKPVVQSEKKTETAVPEKK